MKYMSLGKGQQGEVLALNYLIKQGLMLKKSNFRCKLGEIDLIMQDDIYLVFIEVRYRSLVKYGGALESITLSKQQKIKKTAMLYLQIKKLYETVPIRFDVVAIEGHTSNIHWLKDAF